MARFGKASTAMEVAGCFGEAIKGKIAVITGVSPNSLGAAIVYSLVSQEPQMLILASRTSSNVQAVIKAAKARFSGSTTILRQVVVDLSSLSSVRSAATTIAAIVSDEAGEEKGIDVLFNNAGINISERRMSTEGVEMQFATNHLGPFILTNLLTPLLQKSGCPRVINTSSEAHRLSPVRFSDINQNLGKQVDADEEPRRGLPEGTLRGDGRFEPMIAYAQSKCANILFSVALNERGIRSCSVSPGNIMTGLTRGLDERDLKNLINGKLEWKNLDQGAATMILAGFDPELIGQTSVYLEDCQPKRPSKWAIDSEKAERLWKLSEDLVGEKFGTCKRSRL